MSNLPRWVVVINTLDLEVDEDTINKSAGSFAGRIGRDTYVDMCRRLEPNEKIKVVEKDAAHT